MLAQILTDLAAFRYQYPLENEISVSENKASGFQRIINYINANYTTLQTVRDIAESCGVSESYVHRAVRRTESLTVKEYINKLRLRHAIHQVEQGGNSLSVISKSCGFQSVSYFTGFLKTLRHDPYTIFSKKNPITFCRSLSILMDALMASLQEILKLSNEQLAVFTADFESRLPRYLRNALHPEAVAA